MADSPSGVSRLSPTRVGGPRRSSARTQGRGGSPAQGEQRERAPSDFIEKQYIRIEGRVFDLTAPRGTYLNILV